MTRTPLQTFTTLPPCRFKFLLSTTSLSIFGLPPFFSFYTSSVRLLFPFFFHYLFPSFSKSPSSSYLSPPSLRVFWSFGFPTFPSIGVPGSLCPCVWVSPFSGSLSLSLPPPVSGTSNVSWSLFPCLYPHPSLSPGLTFLPRPPTPAIPSSLGLYPFFGRRTCFCPSLFALTPFFYLTPDSSLYGLTGCVSGQRKDGG